MLAHILGILVGLGSFTLYMAAFFFPEVHRRHDFFWSGLGLFYASVLWFCAEQMSATEVIGQTASVVLLGWFGWQTLTLRRKRTPLDLQTPVTKNSWANFRQELLSLAEDFIRQTPLRRFLPPSQGKPSPLTAESSEFRASSLKDVGYEFLDELEPAEPQDAVHGRRKFSPLAAEAGNVSSVPEGKSFTATASQIPSPEAATANHSGATSTAPQRSTRPQRSATSSKGLPKKPSKPITLWEKAVVVKNWLVEVVTSVKAPKPQKPVIEIPPRPPSEKLVKNNDQASVESDDNPSIGAFPDSQNGTRTSSDLGIPSESSQSVQIVDTKAIQSEPEEDQPSSPADSLDSSDT
jgi:hypothetical protein